jgi:GT2 family glycosyltransferase
VKPIVFPDVAVPEVSIVIVAFGAEEWLFRCLEAVRDRTEPCYEVIVVDNASPEGLAARVSDVVPNARVISNPINRGFGPASNQGANVTRGRMLVFLNSDALVHEGWLTALLGALDADPRAAAVAPQLRNLDGTVQEAGALLFSNGVTDFYGMGDDPGRAEYLFRREVDYASAACLAVTKRAFFEVGGFDATFAPAYYEDVDLCLELSQRGYRVLYEPRAIVTHVRGASSSSTLAARLWQRNHPIFYARWKGRLASRPEHRPPESATARLRIAARDAPARAKILVVVGEDRDAAREASAAVECLYADCLRSIARLGGTPAEESSRLAERGWEVLETDAIADRPFHYDAVVHSEALVREGLVELLAASQPQAVLVRFEAARQLEEALVRSGIPPSLPAALSRRAAVG